MRQPLPLPDGCQGAWSVNRTPKGSKTQTLTDRRLPDRICPMTDSQPSFGVMRSATSLGGAEGTLGWCAWLAGGGRAGAGVSGCPWLAGGWRVRSIEQRVWWVRAGVVPGAGPVRPGMQGMRIGGGCGWAGW
jgi:hypothetical protein